MLGPPRQGELTPLQNHRPGSKRGSGLTTRTARVESENQIKFTHIANQDSIQEFGSNTSNVPFVPRSLSSKFHQHEENRQASQTVFSSTRELPSKQKGWPWGLDFWFSVFPSKIIESSIFCSAQLLHLKLWTVAQRCQFLPVTIGSCSKGPLYCVVKTCKVSPSFLRVKTGAAVGSNICSVCRCCLAMTLAQSPFVVETC